MNMGVLFDLTAPDYTARLCRTHRVSGPSAFAGRLTAERETPVHRFIQGPGFSLRMGKNILCSGGVGGANVQTYEAEFMEDSTDEDPIVRITGAASSGAFDFTCHIRDIDPANASYVELAALNRWLCRTGTYQTKFPNQAGNILPCGMRGIDCGDISEKRDFIRELQGFLASASNSGSYPKFGPETYAFARELLETYQAFSHGQTAAPGA